MNILSEQHETVLGTGRHTLNPSIDRVGTVPPEISSPGPDPPPPLSLKV